MLLVHVGGTIRARKRGLLGIVLMIYRLILSTSNHWVYSLSTWHMSLPLWWHKFILSLLYCKGHGWQTFLKLLLRNSKFIRHLETHSYKSEGETKWKKVIFWHIEEMIWQFLFSIYFRSVSVNFCGEKYIYFSHQKKIWFKDSFFGWKLFIGLHNPSDAHFFLNIFSKVLMY